MPKKAGPRLRSGAYYSKGKKRGRKPLKQVIDTQIRKASETKSVFMELDEHTQSSQENATTGPFSLIAHGSNGNQRVGNQIDPTYFTLNMHFRPRSLEGDDGTRYDSAFYSRVIIVRQKPQVRVVSGTPAPLLHSNAEFFMKGGKTTGALAGDFKDLYYKVNPQLATVIYDKKFFISGSQYQNNTREINFKYRFPKTARMNFTDGSSYPHEMINLYIINRKADDDIDASPKTIEYCLHSELFYKDL